MASYHQCDNMLSMYTVAVYVYCSFVHIITLHTIANIHANENSKVAGIILKQNI